MNPIAAINRILNAEMRKSTPFYNLKHEVCRNKYPAVTRKSHGTETVTGNFSEETENDLIESCRQNDPRGQFQMYRLYYREMYNISLRIINDPLEAEDIMQESFLVAFDRIGSFSGAVRFDEWLTKIVQRRSIEILSGATRRNNHR